MSCSWEEQILSRCIIGDGGVAGKRGGAASTLREAACFPARRCNHVSDRYTPSTHSHGTWWAPGDCSRASRRAPLRWHSAGATQDDEEVAAQRPQQHRLPAAPPPPLRSEAAAAPECGGQAQPWAVQLQQQQRSPFEKGERVKEEAQEARQACDGEKEEEEQLVLLELRHHQH